ncbi:hypothetical protein [Flavobacterium sp.]
MQERYHDGSYGKIAPLNSDKLEDWLRKPEVSHVEVFEGTPEEIARREKFKNQLKVKKRFQKVPKNKK